jgi:hypothetical protein
MRTEKRCECSDLLVGYGTRAALALTVLPPVVPASRRLNHDEHPRALVVRTRRDLGDEETQLELKRIQIGSETNGP